MRERINRLARGIVDSSVPELVIKPERIEGILSPGESVRGEFSVQSGNDLYIKGLVYTGNERVKVENEAFGGLRNHIIYEIDTRYLEDGDTIKGSFYLVTNGGEKEIPYSLRIQTGNRAETLVSLKTPRDFAALAKKNWELALRLFEYQDFTEAPFMQDVQTRTIYEGLKGRNGRNNLLEEFLVALHVKEPVSLKADVSGLVMDAPETVAEDVICVTASGWGYAEAQVEADGTFLSIERNAVTTREFDQDKCQIHYQIFPQYLHGGRNFGAIRIKTLRQEFVLPIEVVKKNTQGAENREKKNVDDRSAYEYIDLLLSQEFAGEADLEVNSTLIKKVENLRARYPEDVRPRLWRADQLCKNGRKEAAVSALAEVKDTILKCRDIKPELYCYYQYLELLNEPSEDKSAGLARYIRKLLSETRRTDGALLHLLIKTDRTCLQNPLELYEQMRSMFGRGCRSPFLYGEACRLLNRYPDLFVKMGDFEVQLLLNGLKNGWLSKEIALMAAVFLSNVKYYHRLLERLAAGLYKSYPEMKILEALCSLLIRGDRTDRGSFAWYEKAMKAHINLTRLYEYFLYSLPEDYGHALPKEVLLYFSYDKSLDQTSRSVLYKNILQYVNPSSDIYQTYVREMEQFAMEQLFAGRMNGALAVIYEHMLYKDMIDTKTASILPKVLCCSRVKCENSRMKYVVVRCEELYEEEAFPLENGEAYVPVVSKNTVLFFQDVYGGRYFNVSHRRLPAMDQKELLDQCYRVYPDHPILKLRACEAVVKKGVETEEEILLLEDTLSRLKLNPVYEKKLLGLVTDYYCKKAASDTDQGEERCTFLIQMDKSLLDNQTRKKICEILIRCNYLREAYDMLVDYQMDDIDPEELMDLCTRMILQQLFDQDEHLLYLAEKVFEAGKADSVILDYLCEHYNGTTSRMYEILIQAAGAHVETYDLEERLLAQMLFTGNCAQIDSVFDLYMKRKQTRESMVKAYFTQKCIQYFLEGKEIDATIFGYLKNAVNASMNKEKLPTIYLLALTRYYGEQKDLEISEEEKKQLQMMLDLLLEGGMVFPYMKQLAGLVSVPEDIMDKTIIEYRGDKNRQPWIEMRILPQEEHFTREEMRRVYQGIYIKEITLFKGETLEYQIYERKETGAVLVKEDRAVCSLQTEAKENSRFACLNQMSEALAEQDPEGLLEAMEDYVKKSMALGILFPVK